MKHQSTTIATLAFAATLAPASIQAAVVFSELNFTNQTITLHNTGTDTVDLGGWRFCSHDFNQARVYSSSSALNGQTIAANGGTLVVALNTISFAGPFSVTNPLSVGLYNDEDGSLSFSSADDLSAFIQYNPVGNTDLGSSETRTGTAQTAGLWGAPGTFVEVAPTDSLIVINDVNVATGASSFSPIPEPSVGLLAALGVFGLTGRRKRA